MVLGFREKFPWGAPTFFPEKIISGIKKTTIRKGNRWKSGIDIQFATGVRTKNYKQFASGTSEAVNPICIIPQKKLIKLLVTANVSPKKENVGFTRDSMTLWIDLSNEQIASLSFHEGFDSVHDFWRWFNEPLQGQLIQFTNVEKV